MDNADIIFNSWDTKRFISVYWGIVTIRPIKIYFNLAIFIINKFDKDKTAEEAMKIMK